MEEKIYQWQMVEIGKQYTKKFKIEAITVP